MHDFQETFFTLYPFYYEVMSYLTAGDILRLSRVSRRLRQQCKLWLSIHMDIRKMLRQYIKDVNMFRAMQKQTGAVISGSFALQFFSGHRWMDSDLDVFLPESQITRFGRYLVSKEKYCKIKTTSSFYATTTFKVSVRITVKKSGCF
jgi:hypothetical protein